MTRACPYEYPSDERPSLAHATEHFPPSGGEPLDGSIRAFMEARFGVDLGTVRIHTGRWAVKAARGLNARAFTRGKDIYFGAGQYAPEKPGGRWLLAHELAHVLQQWHRQGNGSGGAAPLGDPHSSFEPEADLVADEVLNGDPVSAITRDESGAIRRAITIVTSSAQISLNNAGAKAAVTAAGSGRQLLCNLTQGFNPADPKRNGSAFDATGSVDLQVDNSTEVTAIERGAMRFGFIQIARMRFAGIFWAGRKSSEGSVGMVSSQAHAWPPQNLISLDSQAAITPFLTPTRPTLNDRPQGGRILVQITDVKMNDHPVFGGPVKVKNGTTVTDNFLFHLKEDVDYFTVLVARDDKGVVTPLSHFRWVIDYDARVRWRGGTPVAVQVGTIRFDTPVQGGPTDPEIRSLLLNPKPPHTNDLHADADRKAVTEKKPGAFSQNPKWFVNVPRDFWT